MALLSAHSRGTAYARLAMKLLSSEERRGIVYAGFGGITQISRQEFGLEAAYNFASRWDLIPVIFSPIETFLKGRVTWVNAGFQNPITAHSFEEKQYRPYFSQLAHSFGK